MLLVALLGGLSGAGCSEEEGSFARVEGLSLVAEPAFSCRRTEYAVFAWSTIAESALMPESKPAPCEV